MKTLNTQQCQTVCGGTTATQTLILIELLDAYGHLIDDCITLGEALGELGFELSHSDNSILGQMFFEPTS